jgi:gliding motility-associated-like protein
MNMKKMLLLLAITGFCAVAQAQVNRTETQGSNFVIPTALTFSNDYPVYTLEILRPEEIKTFSYVLFNRWGVAMVKLDSEKLSWDGTCDGKIVPEGVYLYYIEGEYQTNEKFQFQGSLNIFRK